MNKRNPADQTPRTVAQGSGWEITRDPIAGPRRYEVFINGMFSGAFATQFEAERERERLTMDNLKRAA